MIQIIINSDKITNGVAYRKVHQGNVLVCSTPGFACFCKFLWTFIWVSASSLLLAYILYLAQDVLALRGLLNGALGPVVYTYLIVLVYTAILKFFFTLAYLVLLGHSIQIVNNEVISRSFISFIPRNKWVMLGVTVSRQYIDLRDVASVKICKDYYMNQSCHVTHGYEYHATNVLRISVNDPFNISADYKLFNVVLSSRIPENVLRELKRHIDTQKQQQQQQRLLDSKCTRDLDSAMQASQVERQLSTAGTINVVRQHYTIKKDNQSVTIKMFQYGGPQNLHFKSGWFHLTPYILSRPYGKPSLYSLKLWSNTFTTAYILYLLLIVICVVMWAWENPQYGTGYFGVLIPLVVVLVGHIWKYWWHCNSSIFQTVVLHRRYMELQSDNQETIGINYFSNDIQMNVKKRVYHIYLNENTVVKLDYFVLEISFGNAKGKHVKQLTTDAVTDNDLCEIKHMINQHIQSVKYQQISLNKTNPIALVD